jgi:Zn-dependent protease with chaperone function
MNRREVEAVLGHEVTHVANGDMVTLTLIQGVVNTFVFVASRVIGEVVDRVVFRNERGQGPAFWVTTMIAHSCSPSSRRWSSCGSRASASSAPTAAARASPARRT